MRFNTNYLEATGKILDRSIDRSFARKQLNFRANKHNSARRADKIFFRTPMLQRVDVRSFFLKDFPKTVDSDAFGVVPTYLVVVPTYLVVAPTHLVVAPAYLVVAPACLVVAPAYRVVAPPCRGGEHATHAADRQTNRQTNKKNIKK
jgi:hypothetical protein